MATQSKQKKFKAVSQKVKLFRASEPLLSVLMWGVHHSVTQLAHVNIPVMLLPDDFKAYSKVKVDNQFFNKDTMPSHYKFKEYCPLVFRNLRDRFGVDEAQYLESWTKHDPQWDISLSKDKFIITYDRRYIAKVVNAEDIEQLHTLLSKYHEYVVERHACTLLSQYLALYRITVNDQVTYVLVMRYAFSPRLTVHRKYDLKGSTVDREATEKERARSQLPTLKDNDFVADGLYVDIGAEAKEKMMSMLTTDIEFLQRNGLIHYSLLVGICDVERCEREVEEERARLLEQGYGEPGGDAYTGSESDEPGTHAGPGGSPTGPAPNANGSSTHCGAALDNQSHSNQSGSQTHDTSDAAFVGRGRSVSEATNGDEPVSPVAGHGVTGERLGQSLNLNITGSHSPRGLGRSSAHARKPPFMYFEPFLGQLDSSIEFFAVKSSAACPQRAVYFMSIIDILTKYDVRKRTAQTYKQVKHGANAEFSSVNPEHYARRFLDFVGKAIR